MRASSVGIAQVHGSALVNRGLLGSLLAILLSYAVLLALDPPTAQALASEDAPIEAIGAVFLFVAACLFLACYFRSAGEVSRFFGVATKRNLWFLGLALLMIVCLGEEISWGQRLFGWQTPGSLEALNAQRETNLHNLWLFQASNPDGTVKSALQLLLNPNRLLSIFWLTYCILVPLLVRASDKARGLAAFFGFPVPLLAVGGLFAANYLVFSLIVAFGGLDRDTVSAFDELKETNYEFAFMVLASSFLATLPAVSRPGRESRSVR